MELDLQDLSREMTLDVLCHWLSLGELAGIVFDRMPADAQDIIRRFPDNWTTLVPAMACMNPITRETGQALLATAIRELEALSHPAATMVPKTDMGSGAVDEDLRRRVADLEEENRTLRGVISIIHESSAAALSGLPDRGDEHGQERAADRAVRF